MHSVRPYYHRRIVSLILALLMVITWGGAVVEAIVIYAPQQTIAKEDEYDKLPSSEPTKTLIWSMVFALLSTLTGFFYSRKSIKIELGRAVYDGAFIWGKELPMTTTLKPLKMSTKWPRKRKKVAELPSTKPSPFVDEETPKESKEWHTWLKLRDMHSPSFNVSKLEYEGGPVLQLTLSHVNTEMLSEIHRYDHIFAPRMKVATNINGIALHKIVIHYKEGKSPAREYLNHDKAQRIPLILERGDTFLFDFRELYTEIRERLCVIDCSVSENTDLSLASRFSRFELYFTLYAEYSQKYVATFRLGKSDLECESIRSLDWQK